MGSVKVWLEAFRLRTLPLSLSCIIIGSSLAYINNSFNGEIMDHDNNTSQNYVPQTHNPILDMIIEAYFLGSN